MPVPPNYDPNWLGQPKFLPYLPTTDDDISASFVIFRVEIPNNKWIVQQVQGLFYELAHVEAWVQGGEVEPEEAARAFFRVWDRLRIMPDPIGSIIPYATENIPDGCLACDGTTYNKDDYPLLWEVIATSLKTSTQFTVPDMRGRSIVGAGEGDGLTDRPFLSTGGDEAVILTVDQLATHNHPDLGHFHSVGAALEGLAVAPGELPVHVPNPIPTVTGTGNADVQPAGADQPHPNMPPYIALKWAIVAGV